MSYQAVNENHDFSFSHRGMKALLNNVYVLSLARKAYIFHFLAGYEKLKRKRLRKTMENGILSFSNPNYRVGPRFSLRRNIFNG